MKQLRDRFLMFWASRQAREKTFLIALVTFVAVFFRGPGYSLVVPYLPFFDNSTNGLHFAL